MLLTVCIGIDPSLTGTGVCTIDTLDVGDRRVETFTSKPVDGATIQQRHDRVRQLARKVTQHITYLDDVLVVIEAPAYDSRTGKQHDRSGLWWLIVDTLVELGVPLVEVTIGSLKKYATGSGGAGKDAVLLAVARRYRDIEVTNNNEADALVLAAMGARSVGRPIEDSLPKAHLDAMAAVKWPGGAR